MRKILIIDDEKIIHDSIQNILRHEELVFYSAYNGQEGLDKYYEVFPDVILLDLRMPIMDGYSFLHTLQPSAKEPFSIIVLTGHGVDKDIRVCFDLGVNAFLRKPFNIYQLKGLVRQALAITEVQSGLIHQIVCLEEVQEKLKVENIHLKKLAPNNLDIDDQIDQLNEMLNLFKGII